MVNIDWWLGIAMVGLCAFWIQIMLAYRRQATNTQPQVDHLRTMLSEVNAEIEEVDQKVSATEGRISRMKNAFEEIDERRQKEILRLEKYQMVPVPAGEFLMGSTTGPSHEQPQHHILLNSYLIDRFPVTNAQYKQFVDVAGHAPPPHWSAGNYPIDQANCPVVDVSWEDASAYASWLGKRLPTEAEWEKAARGTEGRVYPWGDVFERDRLNGLNEEGHPTPVDKYPEGASPYGVMDMCGNVSEWTADWYQADYYKSTPLANPTGPAQGKFRVIKGGFFGETMGGLRAGCRASFPPTSGRDNLGFRCAKTPGEQKS